LLGGCGKWDYQYVRNMLRRSDWVQLSDQITPDTSVKLSLPADQILSQDVIILNDVEPESLRPEQWQAVIKLVSERGGSVIIVPGDAKQIAALAKIPGVADLLPFSDPQSATWRIWSGDEPRFRLAPPATDMVDAMKLAV